MLGASAVSKSPMIGGGTQLRLVRRLPYAV
jgi:hypothetical protein